MNNDRVIFFLNLLDRNTSGYEEEIDTLLINAINEDDRVEKLKSLLSNYHFISSLGENLKNEAEYALKELQLYPEKYSEIFIKIEQAYEKINSEIVNTELLMDSPYAFSQPIQVISKKNYPIYVDMLKIIVNSCVYLLVLYGGSERVSSFHWNESAGFRELLNETNQRYIPALKTINLPDYGWTITKRHLGGDAIWGGDAFYIAYEPYNLIQIRANHIKSEKLGPYFYLNVEAFESNYNNVPYCWGKGNVLSFNQTNAIQACLQNTLVTELRVPSSDELQRKIPIPMEVAKTLANNKDFCISAEQLLLAMNQWIVGREIHNRRIQHKCLICGNTLENDSMVCRSHFAQRGGTDGT